MKHNRFICPPCGESVAVATKEGQHRKDFLVPRLTAVLPPQGREMLAGFTLVELLIVIIIIAVLAIVAWPQYKHAILKSRYSALSPIAHHLKTAQEAYYMGNDYYSEDLHTLDLDVPGTITSATTASYGDDMSAKISSQADAEEEYSYVLASKEGLNNNYIMYQEHSKNYPGEIHCEAKNGDSYAQWLCEKGLSGQKIEKGSITPGYTTYVISGSGNGTFLKECEQEKELEDSSCACGKRTRTTTGCNEETGQWNYSEWSSCPVKPEESKVCSELDSKWTSGTATRTSQCEGGSWTEPGWDDSGCEIACKEEEKEATKDCEGCGTQTAGTVTCNTRTGEWEYSNWSECPVKPNSTIACTQLSSTWASGTATCNPTCNGTSWNTCSWNTSSCVTKMQALGASKCSGKENCIYTVNSNNTVTTKSCNETFTIRDYVGGTTASQGRGCIWRTYNQAGTQTNYEAFTCQQTATYTSLYENGDCKKMAGVLKRTFDTLGRLTSHVHESCETVSNGICNNASSKTAVFYTYDATPYTAAGEREVYKLQTDTICVEMSSSTRCKKYSVLDPIATILYFDENNNYIGQDQATCSQVDSSGRICTAYSSGWTHYQ